MALNKKYAWYPERERIGLVIVDGVESRDFRISSVETTGMKMRILATSKPLDFTTAQDERTTTSAFPPQFHAALPYRCIAEFYRDPRNLNLELAEYYQAQYEKIVKLAKHYGKRGHIGFGTLKGVDF
jgi:hypothetical protein